ncbi:hypothetical protein EF294_03180 [Gordonia oryzae]|uniref:Uncharacterized protein n=1 Tax=Gordonia oryzae TaxID=2487349 RepID=A0A3N4HFV8_9ACTN|nr:hypothetical protein [Gordonia oryzae]RPA65754.1 hypothetical protein EF294_03180 [Gordonia oryzae]
MTRHGLRLGATLTDDDVRDAASERADRCWDLMAGATTVFVDGLHMYGANAVGLLERAAADHREAVMARGELIAEVAQ